MISEVQAQQALPSFVSPEGPAQLSACQPPQPAGEVQATVSRQALLRTVTVNFSGLRACSGTKTACRLSSGLLRTLPVLSFGTGRHAEDCGQLSRKTFDQKTVHPAAAFSRAQGKGMKVHQCSIWHGKIDQALRVIAAVRQETPFDSGPAAEPMAIDSTALTAVVIRTWLARANASNNPETQSDAELAAKRTLHP